THGLSERHGTTRTEAGDTSFRRFTAEGLLTGSPPPEAGFSSNRANGFLREQGTPPLPGGVGKPHKHFF
ncbi:unnamed protein product, partial [Laminaria digitata]